MRCASCVEEHRVELVEREVERTLERGRDGRENIGRVQSSDSQDAQRKFTDGETALQIFTHAPRVKIDIQELIVGINQ
ncbi:hypothetical protein CEXT_107121 [Caerostris extrusa]|uniref:Uncharacterized protein n=1 Tax=Caerostris extrusa TaxID=172846 RepID=A0AAV4NLY6_CAEEX|nr:hypothetical protein CEXT_107121 [Caerostris extrusa]